MEGVGGDDRPRGVDIGQPAGDGEWRQVVVDDDHSVDADALERRDFFDRFAARYAELRQDSDAWGEIETERAQEGGSLSDHSA